MTDSDDIDLNALGDDELVAQRHDDLNDGLKEEIEEGVNILLARGWEPYKVLTEALVSLEPPPNDIGLENSQCLREGHVGIGLVKANNSRTNPGPIQRSPLGPQDCERVA